MKHNKLYIRSGVINKKYATIPGALKSLNNPSNKIVKKNEETAKPRGSSVCLYNLFATFMNFISFILIALGFLCLKKQIKGTAIYAYPIRVKEALPLPSKLKVTSIAAKRAIPAESKIFTLLKVQKPDFSTTGELGNLLLKYAIAFFLLASNLGLLSKLLVNICTFHNKVALHIICNFNTKKHLGEL